MELKTIKQEKNVFLHREESLIEIVSKTNPSFEDVKKQLETDSELTVVKKIGNSFGRNKFIVEIFVYDSKENKDKIEKIPRAQAKKLAVAAPKPAPEPTVAPVADPASTEEVNVEKTE